MEIWLVFAILSGISGSIQTILRKSFASDKKVDIVAFGTVFPVITGILLFVYAILTGQYEVPAFSGIELNWVILIVSYSVAATLTNLAFRYADASEISPLTSSGTAWTLLFSYLILDEDITITKIIAIAIIVFGVYILYDKKGKYKWNKGHIFAIMSAVLWGLAFVNDVFIIKKSPSIISYLPYAYLLPGIATILFRVKSLKNVPALLKGRNLVYILILSILAAAGYGLKFLAYEQGGEASVISIILRGQLVLVTVISYFLLKEKSRMLNKVIGTLLILAGVLIVV